MEHYAFAVPSVWEYASQLRFGIDTCILRMRVANRKEVILLQHMRMGISRSALFKLAHRLRISRVRVETLLERLEPVLLQAHGDTQPLPKIAVFDDYHSGHRISQALQRQSFTIVAPSSSQEGVAVTIDRFGYDADRIGLLLAHDMRVFPLRITDGSFTFGPLLDGGALCGRCIQLADLSTRPTWLTWQEQLVGREIPAERTHIMEAVAPLGATFLRDLIEAGTPHRRLTVTFTADGRECDLRYETVRAHPSCNHQGEQVHELPAA